MRCAPDTRRNKMSKKEKYYFRTPNSEFCYTLAYHISEAKYEKLTEIELFEARKENIKLIAWCKDIGTIVYKGD